MIDYTPLVIAALKRHVQSYRTLLLFVFLLLNTTTTHAAFNDVTLSSTTVTVAGYNLTLTGQIQSLITRTNDFDVVLQPGSSLTVLSTDKKDFGISVLGTPTYTESCNTNDSSIVFTSPPSTSTTTISIVGNCAGGSSAPGQVTGLTLTPGNTQMLLSWTAPSNGGSAITDYIIEYKIAASSTYTVYNDGTSTLTTTTILGLTNGAVYNIHVAAKNAIGTGVFSNVVSGTPTSSSTAPSAPQSVTAVAGDGLATITFSAPASNGGSPITAYTVTSVPGGLVASGLSSPLVVTGLTNSTPYTFNVTATNLYGVSAPTLSNSVTPVAVSSGGGGGGGGGGYYYPPSTATTTPHQTASSSIPVTASPQTGGSSLGTISDFLWKGKKNDDVITLQKVLIKEKLLVVGKNETLGNYGDKTELAVKNFQCKYKIVCSGSPAKTGWGIIGTKTKNALNAIAATMTTGNTTTVAVIQTPVTTTPTLPVTGSITSDLSKGSHNMDTYHMQQVLVRLGFLKPAKTDILGIFGAKTEVAVKSFQCAYKIICSGTPESTGWGVVSGATLDLINKLSQ